MKRMLLLAPVLAVAVVVVLTTTGGAQTSGERTLKFVEKGGSGKFVDNPPRQRSENQPPSAGDFFVFTSVLYDESGARVGRVIGHCIIAPKSAGESPDCQGDAKLKDGTLAFSGIGSTGRKTVLAVTGGTGAYEGARGTVTSISRSSADNAPSDDTVHLLG